jgi:3',5'-cyclic AMP phosphodiesterase CpdA
MPIGHIDERHLTKQAVIIHLSDLHFGKHHRFNPPPTTAGDIPVRVGYPTLLEKLAQDLDQADPKCPTLLCITGDLAETGDPKEFGDAELFLRGLANAKVFGHVHPLKDIFIVPGNHDVVYAGATARERFTGYAQLLGSLSNTFMSADSPLSWPILHDRTKECGVIVVTLNSSIYVQKDKPDEERGHLDVEQLKKLEDALKNLPGDRLNQAIKIALIHHHPVLIPALAEPGRGYDAVHNSGKLLTILRRYGFHVVLHGHKHDPYVFTEDSRSALNRTIQNPILVAAGGSLGSNELPLNRRNCYNRISIKWHPAAGQARILIETVGLDVFDEDGNEALPGNWTWRVLRREDIHFLKGQCVPNLSECVTATVRDEKILDANDHRHTEYKRLRGNMLCVDVRPSLSPDQGYEAIVWITPHPNRTKAESPTQVEWSAGEKFRAVYNIARENDGRFCGRFDYWGPMLIQATMLFADGKKECAFIYARIPEDCTEGVDA